MWFAGFAAFMVFSLAVYALGWLHGSKQGDASHRLAPVWPGWPDDNR